MKAQTLLKTITVAGALAATLTLSACDMHISFGQEAQGQEQDGQQSQGQQREENTETTAEEQTAETRSTSDSSTDGTGSTATTDNETAGSGGSTDPGSATSASDTSTSSGSSSSSGTTDNEGYQGPRIGEEGVELDADGYGKIPADVLEKDIKHAYAKQGTTVDTVDCYADLRIMSHRGSQSCTVTAAGKKHYGTVKITSASQSGIGYSLEFPNI